jgi:hypothetical protein
MNKVEEIFKAWGIFLNHSDQQFELASKRIEICDACEFKDIVAIGPVDILARCTVCGCALKQKIYTPVTYRDPGGSCPKNKWSEAEDEYLNNK